MSDNPCSDGVETPLRQRRKVSFQFAIFFDQGVAKYGDQHPAAVLASRACQRHGLTEGLLQALYQLPSTTVTHPNGARPLRQRTGISDGFEEADLPRTNAGMFREIDSESNHRSGHSDSSPRHHSEGESPVNNFASGSCCDDLCDAFWSLDGGRIYPTTRDLHSVELSAAISHRGTNEDTPLQAGLSGLPYRELRHSGESRSGKGYQRTQAARIGAACGERECDVAAPAKASIVFARGLRADGSSDAKYQWFAGSTRRCKSILVHTEMGIGSGD